MEAKTRRATLKESKICVQCGNNFDGIYSAFTCSQTCRNGMNRFIKRGQVPKYYLDAMKNGQKVPKLSHQRIVSVAEPPNPKEQDKEVVPYHLRRLGIKNS